jgi:hypothetical protein
MVSILGNWLDTNVGNNGDPDCDNGYPSRVSSELAGLDPGSGGTMQLYTKEGRPLQVGGDIVYSRSGNVVGRIKGEKVYGPDGRYVGTIMSSRLVYRSFDSASISSPFSVANRAGCALANTVGSALAGDEPNIPE